MAFKIELKGITKRFPGVVANDKISFGVKEGEIHAIAGENGAGKSTMMNMIFGLLKPDEGQILIDQKAVEFNSARDSIAHKIGMVHQHFMLVPKLTVAENIVLGEELGPKYKMDRKEAERRVKELSDEYGFGINPKSKVKDLTVSMQQRVEILKVLYREAEILIFDEPTAVLAPQEITEFCEIMLNLKKSGKTIMFISHKLDEIMKISNHVTVIRLGKVVKTLETYKTNPEELTSLMVGRSVNLDGGFREEFAEHQTILDLKNINFTFKKTIKKLDNVSLEIRSGEILGICGVDGNGQKDLVDIICGLKKADSGEIFLKGQDISKTSIKARKDLGLSLIPEDRHQEGLVLAYSVADNIILGYHREERFAKNGFWRKDQAIYKHSDQLREDFDIRSASSSVKASTLSGGNQQKIIIAREIDHDPDVIIAYQPTRGLDIGAIEFVQKSLMKQRNKGKAVLLISLELSEVMALSDRIAVIHGGQIVDTLDAKNVSREELGRLMLGAKKGGSQDV